MLQFQGELFDPAAATAAAAVVGVMFIIPRLKWSAITLNPSLLSLSSVKNRSCGNTSDIFKPQRLDRTRVEKLVVIVHETMVCACICMTS